MALLQPNAPYISFIEKVTPDTGSLGDTIVYHGLIVTSSLNPFLGFGLHRMEDQYQFWYYDFPITYDGNGFTASFTPTLARTYKISYITLTGASGSAFYGNTSFPSVNSTLITSSIPDPDPFAEFPRILSIQKNTADTIYVGDIISYSGTYTASINTPITSTQFRLATRPRSSGDWHYSSINWKNDNTFTSSFTTTKTGSYLLDYIFIFTGNQSINTDYVDGTVYYFNTVSSSGFNLASLNDTLVSEITPTPTPTPLPTDTPTPTPAPTATPTPTPAPTATPTPAPTATPTPTPEPTSTPTPTPSPTATPLPSSTPTPTPLATSTPTPTPLPTDTPTPTPAPTATPTPTPVPTATPTPTPAPTATPTPTPAPTATPTPTPVPTATPTPTPAPTATPTPTPTFTPTPTATPPPSPKPVTRLRCAAPTIKKLTPYKLEISHIGLPYYNWSIFWIVYRYPQGGIISRGEFSSKKAVVDLVDSDNILVAQCNDKRNVYIPSAIVRTYAK